METRTPSMAVPSDSSDGALFELGLAHVGGDHDGGAAAIGVMKFLNDAKARAGIGFNGELVAS